MDFVIFCLAASLATGCAEIESGMRSSMGPIFDSEPTWDGASLPPKYASVPQQYGYYNMQNYPQYPPHHPQNPQPTEPDRELPYGQEGSIEVRNDGLFTVLQFYVDYRLNGRKVRKQSGKILTGLGRIITIPSHAEEITVIVQYVGLFDITSDIHVRQFKYPVIRCLSSKDGRNVNNVGC